MDQLNVSVVNLEGSYYELGLKQAEEIKKTHLINQDFLEKLSANSDAVKAKKILSEISPNLLEELRGLAKVLNLELDTIIKFYSGYDVDFPPMGCTTFIHEDYYVRNYDFSPEIYDARLVFSNPIGGYASVGFSQNVIGRLDGMNEKGLVVGLHFVNDEHKGEGFLATTIVRLLLDQCSSVKEAVDFISTIPHGYCYNYSITDSSGEGVIVEASPDKQVVHGRKPLICTNHFEARSLLEKNKKEIQGSIKRKEYIGGALIEELSPIAAYHHFNDGNSPLFFKYYKEHFGTLHTVVYLPKELSVVIGIGENCEPIRLSLKKYLDGTIILPTNIKGVVNNLV
jgi:predicted choloylglycine hydrolase